MSTKKSRLLEQSEGIHFETTRVRLLRQRAETLARCREAQGRSSRPLIFALDTALKLMCIDVPRELQERLRSHPPARSAQAGKAQAQQKAQAGKAPAQQKAQTPTSASSAQQNSAEQTQQAQQTPRPALAADDELVIYADSRASRRRIQGLRCVQWCHPVETITSDGITCVAPLDTWLMLASYVDLGDLVLLGDAMMRRDADVRWHTSDDFTRAVGEFERRLEEKGLPTPRGFLNCRRALRLMQPGTDSLPETQVRLLLEGYGLPRPVVNAAAEVRDERGVARRFFLDLAFPQWGVAVEYDGRHHEEAWESDQRRIKLLSDAQWLLVNVTWDDLRDEDRRRAVVRSVAERIARRGGTVTPLEAPMTLREMTDLRRSRGGKSGKKGKSGKAGKSGKSGKGARSGDGKAGEMTGRS